CMMPLPPPPSTLFPYTTLFRSVGDGYHLWSERYDREMPDVFAIQDEISKAIANRLQVTLGVEGTPLVTPATGNLDAYHLYLKGRSEEHTSELQSPYDLVCRLLL